MTECKRTREASSLRTFFDDQIDYLQNLVDSLSNQFHDEMQQSEQDKQILEHFVDVSNNKMRAVQGYADKLRHHVRALYNHILQIADEIPPPIDLNSDAFRSNTLVNALFVNNKEIDQLFKTDPDAKIFLNDHNKDQAPVLYAVLTVHKDEKSIFGMQMQGDMLMREVLQHIVNFSAHKIHTPSISSTELSIALKEYLFMRVVEMIRQEMMAQVNNQALKIHDNSYESRVNSLANPDVYLNTLIQYIENPANLLCIDKSHIKLSKLGIKLDDDDPQSANEFDVYELIWRNNLRIVVLQVAYER